MDLCEESVCVRMCVCLCMYGEVLVTMSPLKQHNTTQHTTPHHNTSQQDNKTTTQHDNTTHYNTATCNITVCVINAPTARQLI